MSKQRYVSQELTHFVGSRLKDLYKSTADCESSQYNLLIKILQQGELGKIHAGRGATIAMLGKGIGTPLSSNEKVHAQQVCFCDIPVEDLSLHMQKYSRFGLAFAKEHLVTRGATPVFYVSQGSRVTSSSLYSILATRTPPTNLREEFDGYSAEWEQFSIRSQAGGHRADIFSLEQKLNWLFFARLKFFDSTKDEDDEENFYMEREWRVFGTVPFTIEDIARVILPRSFAKQFHADVPEYWGQLTFSE
jgi:hypothetical protein